MKRLLLLLLIPTLSYSQTYEDIMGINSEKTFKRVVIENGFEKSIEKSNDTEVFYISYIYSNLNGQKFSYDRGYYNDSGKFSFEFNDTKTYFNLINKIKKNCTFFNIVELGEVDYVCYSCPQSKYKGKIGFRSSNRKGYVVHFPNY